jgi:hypothetical protein
MAHFPLGETSLIGERDAGKQPPSNREARWRILMIMAFDQPCYF